MQNPDEKKVLVVQSAPQAGRLTARAVAATGARCTTVKTVEQCLEVIQREPMDMVVIDWDNSKAIEQALKINPELRVVLVTNQPVFERHAQDIIHLPMSSMIVSSFVAMPEFNDPVATRELVTTVAKLFTGDIFGLEKYLGWGAAVRSHTITRSPQTEPLVQTVCDDASRLGMLERDISNLGLLVDELLMNAIWDAPVDSAGKPRYNDKSRAVPIELEPHESVELRYGSDGNLFALSVADQFGRLEHDLAVKYIRKCFRENDQQISYAAGGSGLGLYMAYNSASSFVINVDPGVKTEVIGLIRLARAPRPAAGSQPAAGGPPPVTRSLCYFRTTGAEEGK